MVPTHYNCCKCNTSFFIITDKRIRYTCKECKQKYELVPTKYGGMMIIIGGKENNKYEQMDML